MKRLRLWIAALFGWFFLFYNVERIHEPINLASFIYVLGPLVSFPIILFSRLHRARLPWLLLPIVPMVVLLKWLLGYPIAGAHFPITLTEVCVVGVSVWLAHQIGGLLEELRTAVVNTLIAEFHDRTRPFDQGQETMFREIRRARNFRHPVALMAVSPTDQSVELSFDRLSRDVQRETVQSYLTAQIGALLSEETKDCDIVTRRNGHFLALLPQTDRQSARQLMERLKAVSKERLGLDLRIGLSTFPDEEVTLVSLMDRAETNLNRDSAHQFAQEPARGSR